MHLRIEGRGNALVCGKGKPCVLPHSVRAALPYSYPSLLRSVFPQLGPMLAWHSFATGGAEWRARMSSRHPGGSSSASKVCVRWGQERSLTRTILQAGVLVATRETHSRQHRSQLVPAHSLQQARATIRDPPQRNSFQQQQTPPPFPDLHT